MKTMIVTLLVVLVFFIPACSPDLIPMQEPTANPVVPTVTPDPTATETPTATESPTATETPGVTASPEIDDPAVVAQCPPAALPIPEWEVYCNDNFGVMFQYPPEGELGEADLNTVRIDLPVEPGTNLGEKYLEFIIQESSRACESPLAEGYPPEMVERSTLIIKGTAYLKQSGSDAGVGNYWDWIAYSTGKGRLCVYFDFVLHSTNPYNYPTPPPEFDFNAETEDFEKIAGSIKWYTP